MTLPNGADGLADNIALAFPLSAEQLDPNQSLATRDGFDQPTVEELLKDEIRASAGWNTAHQAGYGGLPAGLPQIIGILAKVAEQYTGIPVSTWVAQWNANPVLANLSTVVTDSLAAIYQTSVNIQAFLGSLDFTDPDFDLLQAAETFIDLILAPVGKIATLIGGFISSLIIPGLDASKITTGTFGTGTIPDLDASKIISGIFTALRIPGLDASKIISGLFGQSMVSNLTTDLAARPAVQNTEIYWRGFTSTLDPWTAWQGGLHPATSSWDGTEGHDALGSLKCDGTGRLDTFATQDTSKWRATDWVAGKTFVSSGMLNLKPSGVGSGGQAYIEGNASGAIDIETLARGAVVIKLDTFVNDAATNFFEWGMYNGSGWVFITVLDGNIRFAYHVGTDDITSVAFNATNHKWLRMRHAATGEGGGGGRLYWDTAPDNAGQPGTWTQQKTRINDAGLILENMRPWFNARSDAAAGTAGTQKVDVYYYEHTEKQKGAYSPGIPCQPDQTFTVSAWVKWSGLVAPSSAYIAVWANKADGSKIYTNQVIHPVATSGSSGGWTQFTTPTFTAPADAVEFVIEGSGSTDGNVWFDDFAVTQTNVVPAQAIPSWWQFGDASIPGIPSLRDVLVNAIQGWSGLSGWTDATLSEAANAQRNTIAAQAAEIDRLKARFQSSGFSGMWSVDDFEWTTAGFAAAAPNSYQNGYSSGSAAQGGVYVTGHEMGGAFTGTPGNFDHAVAFDWDACQTDYMKVSAVLNNAFNYRNDGIFDNRDRTMYLLIRSTLDTSTWTRWRLQMRPTSGPGIKARLQSWNGSTFVEHGTEVDIGNLSGGTTIEAVAGVAGNLRRHQLLINAQVVHTVDDTANHGPIGASNRYAGFGAAGVHNGAFIFQIPFPFVNHVVWQDNAAGTRVGCGAEGWRTSTGTITANAGLDRFPMGFFGFTSLASGDMSIDTNWNHGFYPDKAGWYLYEASVKISTGLNDRVRLRLFNWTGSTFVTKENLGIDVMRGLNGGAALQLPRHAQGAAIVYIDPADTNNWNRYLGYEATGVNTANVFTGDATGIETWAKMTFIDDKRPG